jgi:hypothetical protein
MNSDYWWSPVKQIFCWVLHMAPTTAGLVTVLHTQMGHGLSGLSRELIAKDSSFVDAGAASWRSRHSFEMKPLSEHVDFRHETPDDEILRFPTLMIAQSRVAQNLSKCVLM